MESLVPILVYISLGLVGLGLLVMLLFGIKGLVAGKVAPIKLAITGFPIVLSAILALVYSDDPAEGVIIALLITFVVAVGALLLSGVRGLFS